MEGLQRFQFLTPWRRHLVQWWWHRGAESLDQHGFHRPLGCSRGALCPPIHRFRQFQNGRLPRHTSHLTLSVVSCAAMLPQRRARMVRQALAASVLRLDIAERVVDVKPDWYVGSVGNSHGLFHGRDADRPHLTVRGGRWGWTSVAAWGRVAPSVAPPGQPPSWPREGRWTHAQTPEKARIPSCTGGNEWGRAKNCCRIADHGRDLVGRKGCQAGLEGKRRRRFPYLQQRQTVGSAQDHEAAACRSASGPGQPDARPDTWRRLLQLTS